jgi:hypothetical protein
MPRMAKTTKTTKAAAKAMKTSVKKSAARSATTSAGAAKTTSAARPARAATAGASGKKKDVVLLSGGNPQIAKGYGNEPVQAYIAAMPGWKSEAGRHLDRLIERAVPGVNKAVKWNSPLYGMEEGHWFLGIHVFAKYIKVAFFAGALLKPEPPVSSKQPKVRYFHINENEAIDETQFVDWVKQASRLPGEKM